MLEPSLFCFGKSWQDECLNLDVKLAFVINFRDLASIHLIVIVKDDLFYLDILYCLVVDDLSVIFCKLVKGQVKRLKRTASDEK